MKTANIPNDLFRVKKYIKSDPNKIESGINIWISVIDVITVPPIKSLKPFHPDHSSCFDWDIPYLFILENIKLQSIFILRYYNGYSIIL